MPMETSASVTTSSSKESAHLDVDEGEGDTASGDTSTTYKGNNIHESCLHSLLVT